MRWIVRGDIDGFFGLAIDNLVQLLLIDALSHGVQGRYIQKKGTAPIICK